MTDEELMLSVKNGDLDKAAILYERYKNNIYLYMRYRNKNSQERSEDSVQQVFYRLLRYRDSYREGKTFKPWLYGIARNVSHINYKDEAIQEGLRTDYVQDEGYVSFNDEHQAVRCALTLLPEAYREVLMMSKFLDMKYEDIAEVNNCSVGVIKTRVFRALKALKEVYFKIS